MDTKKENYLMVIIITIKSHLKEKTNEENMPENYIIYATSMY